MSAIYMYDNLTLDNNGGRYHEVWLWVIAHHHDFIKAWHDGYTVEKEPLYTVEIPNPNSNAHTILRKTEKGIVLVAMANDRWKDWEGSKLTESEIKQNFEWAFQFAKPVEEKDVNEKQIEHLQAGIEELNALADKHNCDIS